MAARRDGDEIALRRVPKTATRVNIHANGNDASSRDEGDAARMEHGSDAGTKA